MSDEDIKEYHDLDKLKGIINNKVKLKEVKEIMDDVEDYNAENDVRKIIKHGNEQ